MLKYHLNFECVVPRSIVLCLFTMTFSSGCNRRSEVDSSSAGTEAIASKQTRFPTVSNDINRHRFDFQIPDGDDLDQACYLLSFFQSELPRIDSLQTLVSIKGMSDLVESSEVRNAMNIQLLDDFFDFREEDRTVIIIQPNYLIKYQSAIYLVIYGDLKSSELRRICDGELDGSDYKIHRVIVSDETGRWKTS